MKIADMTTQVASEAASAYQGARGSRQIMYQLAKLEPSYLDMYEQAQTFYVSLCERLGVEPEPVFDYTEYLKSDRYKAIMEGRIR